ncbi:MAG: HPP family protein [Vulcanimicrobiota bacterium]
MILAQDVMSREVLTVRPHQCLSKVRELFLEKGISGAPVVDEDGELVGVISVTDLLGAEGEHSYQREGFFLDFARLTQPLRGINEDSPVSDIMSATTFHVGEMTPLHSVASLMTLHQLHRVIVTSGHRKVVGIISSLDLVKHLHDRLLAEL